MARIKKNSEESEEKNNSNSQILAMMKSNEKDHYNFQERVDWQISSGSLLLDLAIGSIGPSVIRLCGSNNEGKSPQTLEICRNFLLTVPESRVLWFLAEGRLSKENRERCQLEFTTNPEEWKDGNVLIIESNVYEFIIKMIKDLVVNNNENKRYCFVIDSLDGLIRREDLDKPPEDSMKVCGPQVLSKKMMQTLSIAMSKYGHLMILTSQVTAAPKLSQYEKTPDRGGEFSGGNSLLHASDLILEYKKSFNGDYILDDPNGKLNDGKSKPIGKWSKVIIQKTTVETAKKQEVAYPIKYGKKPSGIWTEYEICDFLLMFEKIKKGGAGWMTLSEELREELKPIDPEVPEKLQGTDNVRKYLESKPDVTKYLFDKFKRTLSKT